MRIFGNASTEDGVEFPILEIPHPSFVVIREGYLFRNEIFTILEYVGFSVEDLLQHSIYPQEGEIAYIISQVSPTVSLHHSQFDVTGFGWCTIRLVDGILPSTHIHTEHSHIFKRRGQDW